jgi:hypothetical protein
MLIQVKPLGILEDITAIEDDDEALAKNIVQIP